MTETLLLAVILIPCLIVAIVFHEVAHGWVALALGDPTAFTGNGYMLIGLEIDGLAARYREESVDRGGPLMVVAGPTIDGRGLSHACDKYGASVLVLPEASRERVQVQVSLCTQGEINNALLYATVSMTGTHAALWLVDA